MDYIKQLRIKIYFKNRHKIKIKKQQQIYSQLQNILNQYKKIFQIILFLKNNLKYDSNDLFSQQKDSNDWKEINKIQKIIVLDDFQNIQKNYQQFTQNLQIVLNSISYSQDKSDYPMHDKLTVVSSSIYYYFNKQEANEQANLFYADPDEKIVRKIWSLIDYDIVKIGSNLIYQSITQNVKLFVPYTFLKLTINNLKQFQDNPIQYIIQEMEYDKSLFKKDQNKIQIRLLSKEKLYNIFFDNIFNYLTPKRQPQVDCIVIHIHGGGFISMSSSSHQIYTRQWANILGYPIFSIDYKLAPENQYPQGLNDCWQAYLHILQICKKVYEFEPKKIILAGDSAGGNFIASLAILCIQTGVRKPDGLLMVYPAVNLSTQRFTPSFLHSLDDQFLPYSMLQMCVKLYLGENIDLGNQSIFVSPILANNNILEQYPNCKILVGSLDSLHDDCVRFTQKLQKLNNKIQLIVYPGMPHGFLNLDYPQALPQAHKTVLQSAQLIKELAND